MDEVDVTRRSGWMKMGFLWTMMDGKWMWMENVDVVFLETRKKQDKGRQAKASRGDDPDPKKKERSGEGTVRVHECVAQ